MRVTGRTVVKGVALAALLAATAACVPAQQEFRLYPEVAEQAPTAIAQPAAPATLGTVAVRPWDMSVFEENPEQWLPYAGITAADYQRLLEQWLAGAGAFQPTGGEPLILTAELEDWVDLSPSAFGPSTFEMHYRYRVTTEDGEELLDRRIVSRGEDSTFMGLERMQLAMQKAHVDSARKLVATLDGEFRQAWAARTKDRELAAAERARIAAAMQPVTGFYRGQADGAAIRALPNTESARSGSLEIGAVYRVSGRLPDGWLRVAREGGDETGWAHEGGLTRLTETEIKQRLAEEEARRAAAAERFMLAPAASPSTLATRAAVRAAPRSGAPTTRSLDAGMAVEVVAFSENGYALVTQERRFVGWIEKAALQP